MKVGIVGLPQSGKTTLFRALTRGAVSTDSFGSNSGKANIGVVNVPDERVDFFVKEYSPKKITYASIEFVDGAAKVNVDSGKSKFGSDFFADVRQVDMLVNVLRGFESDIGDSPTPVKDIQQLMDELLLADLQMIEKRLEKIEKQMHGVKKGVTNMVTMENDLLHRLKAVLEEGKFLKIDMLSADEEKFIRNYDFLTLKPIIHVLNVAESDIGSDSEVVSQYRAYCEANSLNPVVLCAELEQEVSQLSDEDEAEFLKSSGIEEPARNVLIKECYEKLGLISFITAGEPEVRAWTLNKGMKAVDAAGTIHSDLARGFIRMEVANFDKVKEAGGWELAKKAGIVELQMKDYIVQDGDVVYIRFKV
ncbi:MAG: redox-regulated ATPase YchF [Armatimonadota bacterium]